MKIYLLMSKFIQNRFSKIDFWKLFFFFISEETKKKLLKSVTVTIGKLGNFTYDQPKLIPKVEGPLPPPPQQMNTKDSMGSFTVLSREQCKDALIKYADGLCCGTSKPAKEANITNIKSFNSYRVSSLCYLK